MPAHKSFVADNPQLMKFWDRELNPAPGTITGQSARKMHWLCPDCSYSWSAMVQNMARTLACSRCKLKNQVPRLISNKKLMQEFSGANTSDPTFVSLKSKELLHWVCAEAHETKERISTRLKKGCKICYRARMLQKDHPRLVVEWVAANEVSIESAVLSGTYLWQCSSCTHLWRSSLANRRGGTGCPACYRASNSENRLARNTLRHGAVADNPALMREWDFEKNTRDPSKTPLTYSGYAYWRCEKAHHTWRSKVSYRLNREWGCPFCTSHEVLVKAYTERAQAGESFAHLFPELLEELSESNEVDPYSILPGSHTKLLWRCKLKRHEWHTTPANRIGGRGCPECWRESGKSQLEQDVAEAVRSLGHQIVVNSREVIPPLEVDIYLSELAVAIEVNGDYWHSDEVIQRVRGISAAEYHSTKVRACEKAGVRLLFVWESQWRTNSAAVLASLQDALRGEYVEAFMQLTAPDKIALQ